MNNTAQSVFSSGLTDGSHTALVSLATGGSVVLVWTGIALALRRGRAWIGRRARAAAGSPARPQPEPSVSIAATRLNRVEETQ